jgi:hypothetical protein
MVAILSLAIGQTLKEARFLVIINEDDIMHLLSAISQYSVEATYSGADSLAVS